jgi:two-component system OmpR family sensor kinase
VHPLRSLRNRLAVVFGLIVLGAIATVYLTTVPRLEDRLTGQKLDGLESDALRSAPDLATGLAAKEEGETLARRVANAASRSSAEVIVMKPLEGKPTGLTLAEDSTVNGGVDSGEVSRLALDAYKSRTAKTATLNADVGPQALAAEPLIANKRVVGVAVFADALADVEANVALIRRQILVSGAAALVIALLAGYLVARALSLRVKRLERAARKVSAGDFTDPIRADSDDELGQLAAAFDDMQAQLARLDRARKQFIASASHELRTPIFSLGGFLELRPEPTDVGQLAREVAAEFTPAASRHRADVELALAGEPIELDCDPERVAQVLRILLDNALVHTPEGTGVRVSAARANGHVRLEVSDRGLGIKRQNMPHIFEPFFTSNDEAQGAGLGLAIARELAERMHGELSVRSVPGRTTFSLELPS